MLGETLDGAVYARVVLPPDVVLVPVERVCELARACGKNPIVVADNPMVWGFVANRIYSAMLLEAGRVAAEGIATQDEINTLMVDCFNWPVGPYGMAKGARDGWS